jgi:hypothetical protein
VCEFRRSGGAAPGINIPVGNDGGIDVNIGITIGNNDNEHESRRGFFTHYYETTPSIICPAAYNCTIEQLADALSRFPFPGHDPSNRVKDGDEGVVFLGPIPFGEVNTYITPGLEGLQLTNVTQLNHFACCGTVTRTIYRDREGNYLIKTIGSGVNLIPYTARVNERYGKPTFEALDKELRAYVDLNYSG